MQTVIFYDEKFPFSGTRPSESATKELSRLGRLVNAEELAEALHEDCQCLVSFHGSYFPKEAWGTILQYLQQGRGLAVFGGVPFREPVRREGSEWFVESEQTAYHRAMGIHEALPVSAEPIVSLKAGEEYPWFEHADDLLPIHDTVGFVLHVTRTSDMPGEMGSAGPMDARVIPLLRGVDAEGRFRSAPAVLIENRLGVFAGGRWMFVPQALPDSFFHPAGMSAMRAWAGFLGKGVNLVDVMPNYATYVSGEKPRLRVVTEHIKRERGDNSSQVSSGTLQAHMAVRHFSPLKLATEPSLVWTRQMALRVHEVPFRTDVPIDIDLTPGYYELTVRLQEEDGEQRVFRQGFWTRDEELLQGSSRLTASRDYFLRDKVPFPVVGMTYMASDVHRKFLFLPNPAVWAADMRTMKEAGINLIRTGIWTAWRQVMFVDGYVDEAVLRAYEAFVHCAKVHDLEVVFTFFAFTPESWNGVNPYLDTRSRQAQKRFIAAFVERVAKATNLHFDLINEPSMFDPSRIFSGPRSAGDTIEHARFSNWLQARHQNIESLQERWNMTPLELPSFTAARPPEASEMNFDIHDMASAKRGERWLDYCLFTMDMHNEWAKDLQSFIQSIIPEALVTVGQDEALAGLRPSPLFYANAVDYTTVHSWWQMDNLVWDGVFTKSLSKPNLVQETGIMYLETARGFAKRTEAELASILERKYAYAFATAAAGAVQWIWNTNYYMDNVNESNIGALRADGSERPEAQVSYDFGRFIGSIRNLFSNRQLEDVAVVYPYSNDFSNRRFAYDATTKASRVLAYELKVPFRGVSEYHLQELFTHPPKLCILPSAHHLDSEAFTALMEYVQHGGVLLVTGPLSLDEYFRPTDRAQKVAGTSLLSNVMREEMLWLDEQRIPVSFHGHRIAQVSKEEFLNEASCGVSRVLETPVGRGYLIHVPLPLELGERSEPVAMLYKHALERAGVEVDFTFVCGGQNAGIYGRRLRFEQGHLWVFVSETSADEQVRVRDLLTETTYDFLSEAGRATMFATDLEGQLQAVLREQPVTARKG